MTPEQADDQMTVIFAMRHVQAMIRSACDRKLANAIKPLLPLLSPRGLAALVEFCEVVLYPGPTQDEHEEREP